jgi:hypothetical protein
MLLLAAGGDPHRELDPSGRAVTALAHDLETPVRHDQLDAALTGLRAEAAGLATVSSALDALRADPDAAWRWLAAALLADQLA